MRKTLITLASVKPAMPIFDTINHKVTNQIDYLIEVFWEKTPSNFVKLGSFEYVHLVILEGLLPQDQKLKPRLKSALLKSDDNPLNLFADSIKRDLEYTNSFDNGIALAYLNKTFGDSWTQKDLEHIERLIQEQLDRLHKVYPSNLYKTDPKDYTYKGVSMFGEHTGLDYPTLQKLLSADPLADIKLDI